MLVIQPRREGTNTCPYRWSNKDSHNISHSPPPSSPFPLLQIASALWWYYFSKCVEFLDTVSNQTSCLFNTVSFPDPQYVCVPYQWSGNETRLATTVKPFQRVHTTMRVRSWNTYIENSSMSQYTSGSASPSEMSTFCSSEHRFLLTDLSSRVRTRAQVALVYWWGSLQPAEQ